jgi:hypothetical protein
MFRRPNVPLIRNLICRITWSSPYVGWDCWRISAWLLRMTVQEAVYFEGERVEAVHGKMDQEQ